MLGLTWDTVCQMTEQSQSVSSLTYLDWKIQEESSRSRNYKDAEQSCEAVKDHSQLRLLSGSYEDRKNIASRENVKRPTMRGQWNRCTEERCSTTLQGTHQGPTLPLSLYPFLQKVKLHNKTEKGIFEHKEHIHYK